MSNSIVNVRYMVDDVAAAFATAGGHVDAISAEHTWRAVRLSRRLVPARAEV